MLRSRVVRIAFTIWTFAAVLALGAGAAFAYQEQAAGWKVLRTTTKSGRFAPGMTPEGDHLVKLKLFAANREFAKTPLLVVFPGCGEDPKAAGRPVRNLDQIVLDRQASPEYDPAWVEPGPRWLICAEKPAQLIPAGRSVEANLRVDFLRPVTENLSPRLRGMVFQVPRSLLRKVSDPNRLAQLLAGEQPAAELNIDLYYRANAEKRSWVRGSYAGIFGKGDLAAAPVRAATRDYRLVADRLPVVVSDFRRSMPLPVIDPDGGLGRLKNAIADAGLFRSGRAGDQVCRQDDDYVARPNVRIQGFQNALGVFQLRGLFSTKWTDHSLHPGWGFRVEAWTLEGASWRMLASDWVQSNGTWSLTVNDPTYSGAHLQMVYRSYNAYYKPQDQAGGTYSWADPEQTGIPASFDAGHRYADCDGGDYNGVGELVDSAMTTWSRLYWIGGIDPVHPPEKGPINFHYPNTWDDCQGGSGPPWSCSANGSPDIWLIAAHGIRAEVVTHEMGHQLQNKFWDWKQPLGAGGPHSSSNCYPAKLGMALSEGFANFLPGWVGYPDREVADGGFASGRWAVMELESRVSPPNCANGWENEAWVARTFWDLHDTRTDGDDILWFNSRGAVPAIYLANGVATHGAARDMRDYESVYQGFATAGHEPFITDIFEQNRH